MYNKHEKAVKHDRVQVSSIENQNKYICLNELSKRKRDQQETKTLLENFTRSKVF